MIVVGPKVLIRHPLAVSSLQDMAPGTHFESVLTDGSVNVKNVKTVIFCSGKHFYLLQKEKEDRKLNDCAIVRLEVNIIAPIDSMYFGGNLTNL